MIHEDLLTVPEIVEAVEALKVSSYSQKELELYEKYWEIVRTQKAFKQDAIKKSKLEEKHTIGQNLKKRGFSTNEISENTRLTIDEVEAL